jgi:hypothetical protein
LQSHSRTFSAVRSEHTPPAQLARQGKKGPHLRRITVQTPGGVVTLLGVGADLQCEVLLDYPFGRVEADAWLAGSAEVAALFETPF